MWHSQSCISRNRPTCQRESRCSQKKKVFQSCPTAIAVASSGKPRVERVGSQNPGLSFSVKKQTPFTSKMRTLTLGALAAAAHAAQYATFTPFVEVFPTAGCNTTSTAFDGAVTTAGESPLMCAFNPRPSATACCTATVCALARVDVQLGCCLRMWASSVENCSGNAAGCSGGGGYCLLPRRIDAS